MLICVHFFTCVVWDVTEFIFSSSQSVIHNSEPWRRQDSARMLDCKLEIAFAARIEENDILNYFNEFFGSCL